ncbi:MAG TPA: DsbA family protein [Trueperaceae bacterium]|nr:DsbA family protein [Trueperaceae bacterium]
MAMSERVVVYFDYLCPYSWRLAELIALAGATVQAEWRHVSAYQLEHDLRRRLGASLEAERWQLWNLPLDPRDGSGCKGLLPFLASVAARVQGPAAHDRFRLALLRAVHLEGRPLDRETVGDVARLAGLHVPRFWRDLDNPENRTALAHEHMRAVAAEVTSTPSVVFPGSHVAHVRFKRVPTTTPEALGMVAAAFGLVPSTLPVARPGAELN